MSKISTYEVTPVPKLADKLIGTSVGGEIEDITYNFTLSELLNLFIPNIPANTLQGVLDYGNEATQDIILNGTIFTTYIEVTDTATILNSYLTGDTHILGGLYDSLDSIGTAGQVLISTGDGIEWYSVPTITPDLQQVLTSGNTADVDIVLDANLEAIVVSANAAVIGSQLTVQGTLMDYNESTGTSGQVLASNSTTVQWIDLPVYTATSPLSIDSITKVISIQQASASQNGYLSSADWITFDGKQGSISLTTVGSSGPSTLVGSVINVPNYTLSGLGGVPQTRTLTINGVTYNLSADRTWTIAAGVSSVTATTPLSSTGGVNPDISIQQSSSSLDGYLSNVDWLTFNSKQPAGNYITSLTGEATGAGPGATAVTLSNAAVIGKLLTGLNITGGTVVSTDSILTAFGKVQNQINSLVGGVQYQGVWNAATNTPTLVSSVGTQGYYYIVSVAGNTNLNGITDWQVGDWAIFNGSTWNKVDNTDLVTSVNGQVGAVSLTTDNIPEGATNLYYLDSRARAALSFAAGSGAYNSTTGVITIPTDNSQILNGAGYITLASLSASSPLSYNNLTGAFSIQVANTTQNGYLSSTDWNTFNGKQPFLGGTGLVKSVAGTISYITDNSANWNTAYNDSIVSAAVTGTATKTLTLNQQDGGTITASWSDIDTGLTSVGVSMPSAFTVTNSPLTSNGTIAVTGAGTTLQYIDGTGALRTFPGLTGYVPYTGATQDVDLGIYMLNAASMHIKGTAGNGHLGLKHQSASPAGSANESLIFADVNGDLGWQNGNLYLNKFVTSANTANRIYTFPNATGTIALTSDISYPVTSVFGRTGAVVATEGDYSLTQLSDVTITAPSSGQVLKYNGTAWVNDIDTDTGITSLNGLTALTQTFAVGTSGTDFAISSVTSTHTFNLPTASASNRGALSSADWTTFNSKEPFITAGTTLQYYRGDKTFQTLNTTVVPEGANLYYLDSRARAAVSLTTVGSSGASTYNSTTGVFNIPDYGSALTGYVPTSRTLNINGTSYDLSADRSWSVGTVTSVAALTLGTTGTDLSSSVATGTTTPVITLNVPTASAANRGALSSADWSTFNGKVGGVTATSPLASSGGTTPNITIQQSSGSQAGYLSAADWTTFNNKQAAGNYITSLTGEATATGPGAAAVTLNNASVTGKILTGVNITGGTVQATDTMLTAFGKLQNQINGLIGSTIYQGTWNASTNTPALASGVGVRGYYYIVSVAGTTNLDGITDWFIGDWAIFDGTAWQQVDNTDAVVSVNGQTGAVSLTTDNISEGVTNLYFTNTRARAALSFVAGSGAYNSSTGAITIPTNTNQLTNGASFITLASLSGTAPIVYSNTTGAISITQSGTASNGYLSSTDWNTFNNKQATISLTTTGTSGAATLVGATLNIPQYQSVLTNPVTGSGNNNYIAKFTSTGSTIGNSIIQDNGSYVAINGAVDSSGMLTIYNDGAFSTQYVNTGTGGSTWQVGATNNAYGAGGGKFVFTYGGASLNSLLTLIQATKNVSIGSTTDVSRLYVEGAHTSGRGIITANSTDIAYLHLSSTSTTATEVGVRYAKSDVEKWVLGMVGGGATDYTFRLLGSGLATNVFNIDIATGLTTYNYGIGIGIAAASPFILNALASDSTTNSVIGVVQIGRSTTGTAANGIGGNLQFTAEDTAGTQRTAAYITWKLAAASSAAPQGFLSIGTRNASDALTITDAGVSTFTGAVISNGTISATNSLVVSGSDTTGTNVSIFNTSAGGTSWNIYSSGSAATLGAVGNLIFRNSTVGATRMSLTAGGVLRLNAYGSGGITGTVTRYLAVDVNGDVIETTGGGGSQWTTTASGIYYTGKTSIGTTQFATNSLLLVGDYLNVGSGAIAQFNGFLRIKDQIIIHNSANTALESAIICQAASSLYTSGNFNVGSIYTSSKFNVYESNSSTTTINQGITIGNGQGTTGIFAALRFGTYGSEDGAVAYPKQFIAGIRDANGAGFGDLILGNYQGDYSVANVSCSVTDTAIRVKKSGNVIVGAYNTTDIQPSYTSTKLQVNGNFYVGSTSTDAGQVISGATGGWSYVGFRNLDVAKYIQGYRDADALYHIAPGDSLATNTGLNMNSAGRINIGGNSFNGYLTLQGSHVSGYGLLNMESSDSCLISMNSSTSYDVRIRYKYQSVDQWYVGLATDTAFRWQNASSANSLILTQAGTLTALGDVVAYSDIRFKENIRPIENVLSRIGESRGVLYDRKDSGAKNNIGFIAQELELQFPELVNTDNDGIKSVKYQNAVAVLFEAIKEQQKQIDELKKQVA